MLSKNHIVYLWSNHSSLFLCSCYTISEQVFSLSSFQLSPLFPISGKIECLQDIPATANLLSASKAISSASLPLNAAFVCIILLWRPALHRFNTFNQSLHLLLRKDITQVSFLCLIFLQNVNGQRSFLHISIPCIKCLKTIQSILSWENTKISVKKSAAGLWLRVKIWIGQGLKLDQKPDGKLEAEK